MINEITLASVLADLRDEYKVKPGDFARGYARGVDRAINLLMMWQYRPDSKPEAIPMGLMGGINFGPMPGWSWDQTFNYLRDNLIATNRILMDPNCNDCHNPDCEWKPKPGESVRINCPHWMGEG